MCCVWSMLASYPTNAFWRSLFIVAQLAVIYMQATAMVVVPSSNCYALDNSSYLVDFTDWIGRSFEHDGKDSDLVVRFCKDVERRSQAGYINFGRFMTPRSFLAGSEQVDFIQRFYNGDLMNCEESFDKLGRTAQVNIICGNCLHGACRGEHGCICSVSYDRTMCRVVVELAIPCAKRGMRVFKGFTVGLHPRSWEVVYNGMTQPGFEKPHYESSFGTEQTHVSLYLSALSSISNLVGKPTLKVNPEKGLDVTLTGSGASGATPTTLSPSVLNVNWRCEIARGDPYEVIVMIPVEGYEPIEFTLTKTCGYNQGRESDPMRGWATFGILSCIFVVLSSILCCGGFIYKTRVEHQYGLDALPGMTFLSACLNAVSIPRGYTRGDDPNGNYVNQASWERAPGSAQAAQRENDRRYGTL